MKKERIQFAAILRSDQCIVFGRDHAECIHKSPYNTCKLGCTMGFLTNRKRFVGREEASLIAYKAKQIDDHKEGQVLFSEELWSPTNGGKFDYDPKLGYVSKQKEL